MNDLVAKIKLDPKSTVLSQNPNVSKLVPLGSPGVETEDGVKIRLGKSLG
jgi:hypothetical protein